MRGVARTEWDILLAIGADLLGFIGQKIANAPHLSEEKKKKKKKLTFGLKSLTETRILLFKSTSAGIDPAAVVTGSCMWKIISWALAGNKDNYGLNLKVQLVFGFFTTGISGHKRFRTYATQ